MAIASRKAQKARAAKRTMSFVNDEIANDKHSMLLTGQSDINHIYNISNRDRECFIHG